MKKNIKLIASGFGSIVSVFLKLKIFLKVYNFLFENLPYLAIRFFVKFVEFPKRNYVWIIKLLNGKKVKTKINFDNIKTIQFALSYKWHSPSINKIEMILHNYYPIEVPWIDVGANLGLRSLLPLSDNRPVYFVEPNVELNNINKERCELNGFSNYEFFECGASNYKGTVEFYVDKTSFNSTIEIQQLDESVIITDKITIQVDTIDNLFVDRLDTINNAFIKIDVEGHELKTLEGSKKFIEKVKPTMLIEVNEKGNHFKEFFSIFQSFDYVMFEVRDVVKGKFLKKLDDVTQLNKIKSCNDFLLVKKEDEKLLEILSMYHI